jgi:hypothetical protein
MARKEGREGRDDEMEEHDEKGMRLVGDEEK